MKKLFVIIALVMSGFVFNACTEEVDDIKPQIEVDEVTATDGDEPKEKEESGGTGGN